jgi:cephalosporin hydroxylase
MVKGRMRRGACVLLVASLVAPLACTAPEPEAQAEDEAPRSAADLSDEEVIERFVEIWAREVRFFGRSRWLGVQTLQNPLDAWVTQEIIVETRPDVIVEAGTYRGGSAVLWAMVLEELNRRGRVITIDVEDRTQPSQRLAVWKRKVDFLHGSSTDPAIFAEVKRRTEGKRVLVILDSLHTRDHVLAELRLYADLVPVGGYVIVQDTGVWRTPERPEKDWASDAVDAFLAERDDFVIDHDRERFMLTNNPDGFLKRVK